MIAVFLLDHDSSRARGGGENLRDVTTTRSNRIHDGALPELFGEFFREVRHQVEHLEQVIRTLVETTNLSHEKRRPRREPPVGVDFDASSVSIHVSSCKYAVEDVC